MSRQCTRLSFTDKEITVVKLRRRGYRTCEIARKLEVSEPDISQTLRRIGRKVKNFDDAREFMVQMGIIKQSAPVELTPAGEELLCKHLRSPESKYV